MSYKVTYKYPGVNSQVGVRGLGEEVGGGGCCGYGG